MIRLDKFLCDEGYFSSRNKACESIKNAKVMVNDKVITKPATMVLDTDNIVVLKSENEFVSRSGVKLLSAINTFKIDLAGKTCLDIGASTGGFTDCMLQHDASKVYALDVGINQLDEKLVKDKRVVSLEKVNARYLESDIFEENIDFISIDVSFISLKIIIPVIDKILKENASVVALIKPQFEVGKDKLPKNGVVKDEKDRKLAVQSVRKCFEDFGFEVSEEIKSPIKGVKGNVEFLVHAVKVK